MFNTSKQVYFFKAQQHIKMYLHFLKVYLSVLRKIGNVLSWRTLLFDYNYISKCSFLK